MLVLWFSNCKLTTSRIQVYLGNCLLKISNNCAQMFKRQKRNAICKHVKHIRNYGYWNFLEMTYEKKEQFQRWRKMIE